MLAVPGSGTPEESTTASQVNSTLAFRFLVAIDIEGFSQRSAAQQVKIQDDLERVMTGAATSAGLDRRFWDRQPRGDGELAVLPADANGVSLVADYPRSFPSS